MRRCTLALAVVSALLVGGTHGQEGDPRAALRGQADALAQATLEAQRDLDPSSPYARDCLALAKLHWERAGRLLLGEWGDPGITVEGELAAGEQALAWLAAGAKPHEGVTGRNLTFAYEAENDRSVQPYFLYVPTGYRPDRPAPLLVYLHGWVPETDKLSPWFIGEAMFPQFDRAGCLFLQPHGRGNTDFQGVGEQDVLRTIDLVSRLYAVDPERVYLAGNSMGGYGAYCIGLHHPDRFAALGAACAQSDYYAWYGLDRGEVAPFKRAMYEQSNPLDLFANARALPILVQHGAQDPLVSPGFAGIAGRELARLGYEHEVRLIEGGRHEIYFADSYFERLLAFCDARRVRRLPRAVSWRTYTLDTAGAYWVRVEAIEQWGRVASIDATIEGDAVRLACGNVARVGLLGDAMAELGVARVLEGGAERALPEPGPDGWCGVDLVARPETSLAKRPGLCGPIRAVFERPFLCVYGTRGGAGDQDPLLIRFSSEWWRFCEGVPMLVGPREGNWTAEWAIPDTAVTPEIEAAYSLVLFGTPATNGYLAGIADGLPVRFLEDGYGVGETEVRGPGLGAWFCYPNPRAPERMVLSISGEPWGGGYSLVTRFAHRYDLLPDFIVFEPTFDADDTNRYRAAGFFGQGWELREIDTQPASDGAPAAP